MTISLADLVRRQLPGGGVDEQWPLVGRVIDPHDVEESLGRARKMHPIPAPYAHLAVLDHDGGVFIGAAFWSPCPRVQHRPVHRWTAPVATAVRDRSPAQRDVFAQATNQRVVLSRRGELLHGRNASIHTEQAFLSAGGQSTEEGGDCLLTAFAPAGTADQADPHAADPHDASHGSDNVGRHGALRLLAIAFAKQGAGFVRAQPRDRRGVDSMHGALCTAQAHGFDRQVVQTPHRSMVQHHIETKGPALQGAFDAMPAPAQVHDKGQGGAGEAPLTMDELAGEHGHERDADKVRGAKR